MTFHSKKHAQRRGATVAGLFGVALASVLLLCGAGNVPVENFTPQGPMQADLNSGGHNITNAATVSATNVTVSGALTATNFTLPFARLTSTPTNVAGYGITDAYTKTLSDARYDTNGAAAVAQAASQPLNTNLTAYAASATATSAATAAAVPVSGLTGAGKGVVSALAQPLNGASGIVVADTNNKLPYDPHTANLENTVDVFEGDSITYGFGLTSPSTQSFAALFAAMNYASGHSTVYDVGTPSATIPPGSNSGNNIADHYAANVYPHRPWATAASTAGTGTITGDGNVTITGTGTAFTTQLAVGATIYFNGHLAKIATIPSGTQLTIATTTIPNSPVVTSLAAINPSGTTFTFGGDGGPRANLHLMIGTNDLSSGSYTAAQIIANLTTYTTQALNDRFTVILSTILPAARNGTPESALSKIYLTVNQAIRNGSIPASLVADSAIILNNPSDLTYFQSDQIHPTAAGDVLLAAYYNAGMTAGTFGVRPSEGQFESPLFANFFGPLSGTANPAVNGSALVPQPVYYTYYAPGAASQGFGTDSNLALESFGVNGAKWSWDTGGYQSTGGTGNEVMSLDYNGNLRINGNFKSLATQVGGASATLAVNSRTCFFSSLNETLTLPATCAVGDTVTVVGAGTLSGLFTITKATGQSIYMGSGTAYSSIAEQASGDAVQLTCTVANTSWTASSLVGTFTETP